MSKEDSSGGFLSKMVKFVRHPATNWTDLDTAADSRDSQYSKQALKEMIERKRRNDFVRKREFDMLRKLRSRMQEPTQGYGGRPSFFQSSYSSKPDDRAGTLKKIDEIEAQMSMQWWKTKQGPVVQDDIVTQPPDAIDSLRAYRTTVAADALSTQPPTTQIKAEPRDTARPATAAQGGKAAAPSPITPGVVARGIGLRTEAGPTEPMELDDAREGSSFSVSKFYAVDVQEVAMDPEIEEAAIRFASGDDAAAEQGLLDTVSRRETAGTVDEWMALFDLYRATGRALQFESQAIDFANRFSRSAPQWYSLKDEVAARSARVFQPSKELGRATWTADDLLEAHAVAVLAKVLERSPQPWVLDWSGLRRIQPAALPGLVRLFNVWGGQPVDLRFLGARHLREVLQQVAASGDRSVDRVWWDLRLSVLRVMNLGDDFEMAALDFCVTYEVSPPGWEPPVCHFKSLQTSDAQQADASAPAHAQRVNFVDSMLPDHPAPAVDSRVDPNATGTFVAPPEAELVGEILGDPQVMLDEVDRKLAGAPVIVVSCRLLVRVDFSAAGGILNWASGHHQQGREVRFTHVHRLIAAFFHVIGITEYAKIVTRAD